MIAAAEETFGGADAIATEVLVIGSGAGGAVTAATLAERGREVLLLEEGPAVDTAKLASNSTEAFRRLYRGGGMTPILGPRNVAFIEGRCVGGSTEINSAFWHRLPEHCYHRWRADALLDAFSPEEMGGYFRRVEEALSVRLGSHAREPESSAVMRRGAEQLGWEYGAVPRCQRSEPSGSPFAPGAKQSMQRTYLPRALAAGARLVPDCRVLRVEHRGGRASGVVAEIASGGRRRRVRVRADAIFVCGGAIQSPALLRRSGVRRHVGDNLCIHPMIKAAALFDEELGAAEVALPFYQIKQFSPNVTLGGSVFTPGFLAMTLASDWRAREAAMADWSRMALYYAASRGMQRGRVRVVPGAAAPFVWYPASRADQKNLAFGLARLCELLFAGGARAVYPGVTHLPVLRSAEEARRALGSELPLRVMDLSTVHVFSSCPMGENPDYCATDSFGRLVGFENLHVNDASLIPDSPGVNPQGTTMAIALRNAEHFLENGR